TSFSRDWSSDVCSSDLASGCFSGVISPGDAFEIAFAYDTPGDFILRADLPDVTLMELVRGLTDRPVALPAGFDLEFTNGYVQIKIGRASCRERAARADE